MDNKYTSLKFKAKVKPIEKLNDEFTLCKCYVQGVGKNRNLTYMSKENIIRNSPSLHYAPVVGHLIQKEDGSLYMGGHDWDIDENCNFKSLCVPYGVVTNDEFEFEMVDEYGTEVEYMTADVILWTGRYPELLDAIYSEEIYFNQSMELTVSQYRNYEEDSNYTELLDWTYSALCMLGKADDKNSIEHTEPCFIESKIIPYNFDKSEFSDIMSEMKDELAFYFNKEGDEKSMVNEENFEIIEETNEDTVPEEAIEEIDCEEHIDETEIVEENELVEEVIESNEEVAEEPEIEDNNESEFEETNSEEVREETTEDDCIEPEEVIIEENSLSTEYESYKESHKYSNEEYENLLNKYNELVEFKSNYEAEQIKAEKDAIFALPEYEHLIDNERFNNLILNANNFSVEEIKAKAKEIFADDVIASGTFSINENEILNKSIGIPFNKPSGSRKPYGNLF